jgi:HD-GYP domain-containing protein (c-di-GMP phosphodiesterase class II)
VREFDSSEAMSAAHPYPIGVVPVASEPRAARRAEKLKSLLDVAKALTLPLHIDVLKVVVDEAVKVVDADRGSLFLVDRDRGEIWSKIAHGLASREIRLPLGSGITGYAAASGEIINITDAYADPRFNREVDASTGYRTRTMLCVPMRRHDGEVVGVLLALNKKESLGPFDTDDEELLTALGGLAAAGIDNFILHDEINRLFEGFITASVVAIESRDPTTSGHSERVSTLTLGLAEIVDRAEHGPFAGIKFSREQMKELRYAALLHDFGKVGVRENVLVKAEKLYPAELEALRMRFAYVRKDVEADALRAKVKLLSERGHAAVADRIHALDVETAAKLAEVHDMESFVMACNRPSVVSQSGFDRLKDIASRQFVDGGGIKRGYLNEIEVAQLSIARGSLSEEERREIESHVSHTYRFLTKIPWTRQLRRVPEIAYAHHEKLDGSGYPRKLTSNQIPVQAKMMTIADIYDALTAKDRPYKKAAPHHVALDILHSEAKRGQLDEPLLKLFVDADVASRLKAG